MNHKQNQYDLQSQPFDEALSRDEYLDQDDDVTTWDDTVGSSRPFDINTLTNDEVFAMHQQGRGGPAVAARVSRLQDVAEHDANMGFTEGTGSVIKSKEDAIQAQKDRIRRNEETMQRYQEQIDGVQTHLDHLELAKLQKRLTERRKLHERFEEQLKRLQAN